MKITVKPESVELSCFVSFEEPRWDLVENAKANTALYQLLKSYFVLSLNDIKVSKETPANNLFHFSKTLGKSFLDVSYGLESILIVFSNPENEDQAKWVYKGFVEMVGQRRLSMSRFGIQQQFSVAGGLAATYLKGLNPAIPAEFEKLLKSNGVAYTLEIPDDELTIEVIAVPSVIIRDGIFLSTSYIFQGTAHELGELYAITDSRQRFVQGTLGIQVKE